MRRKRLVTAAVAAVVSAMPLSELYAACTSIPMGGGAEIRFCSNGECFSRTLWKNNQLVSVVEVTCR